MAGFHHVELWVADHRELHDTWTWLLDRVGFTMTRDWGDGQSWVADDGYLTLTTSPNVHGSSHDRRRPGMNHFALKGGEPYEVDAIMRDAPAHGWRPLYPERYPHAGGREHYAGWLENEAGFKVEVVAERWRRTRG